MNDVLVQEFADSVVVLEVAVRRFVDDGGRNPSILYGPEIDEAVSRIVNTCDHERSSISRQHLHLVVMGLGAVATLHYARYHGDENRRAAYLWSAIRLFSLVRRASLGRIAVPTDIAAMLDALAADDVATVPGMDDPTLAIDTAAGLATYAGVANDVDVPTRAEALARAEALTRRIVDALPPAHPLRIVGQHNLLNVLARRWEVAGIDLTDEIVSLVDTVTHPDYLDDEWAALLLGAAGAALYVAASRTHNTALLDRSVELLCRGLKAPHHPSDRSDILVNLGRAQFLHWAWQRSHGRPSEAIQSLRAAVEYATPASPRLAERHAWLAMALLSGNQPEPAEAALHLEAACASRGRPGDGGEPGLLADVAVLLWRVGPKDDALLDQAVDLLAEADSRGAPRGGSAYGEILVETLWERWERTRRIDDIDEVIGRLATRADAPDAPPRLLNLLARSLRARWERTGDSAAIRYAITCLLRAVDRTPAEDPANAMYHHNLGSMWLRLYQASGDTEALEEAIRHTTIALASCRSGSTDLPMFANSAALTRLMRWQLKRDDEDLRESVALARLAVTSTPDDHPDRAAHLANCGAAMMQAAAHFEDVTVLDDAVAILESARDGVSAGRRSHGEIELSLGQGLLMQGQSRNDPALVARGRDVLRRSVEYPYVRSTDAIRALRRWGDEAAALYDWPSAAQALTAALSLVAALSGHRLDRADHEWLLTGLEGLATDAAAACLSLGGDEARALESLEAGRGILLSKSLRHDGLLKRLQRQDESLARKVREAQATLGVYYRSSIGPLD